MRIMHTFSIVARDPATKRLGVAVQTHWFAVGSVCPWAEAGVGVIATQSMVEVSYGPLGLNLLRDGKNAKEVLDTLISKDEHSALRQVAIIDANGNIAVHTGSRCIAAAGHAVGEDFSVQANMMINDSIWSAMAYAYQKKAGTLEERIMAALNAAQTAGGDIRGRQSAAMLVVEGEKTDSPWKHVIRNLRVDDHPEPLQELARLLKIDLAYEHMNKGDEFLSKNENESAMREYQTAVDLAPGLDELPFWEAVTLADSGRVEAALPLFRNVFQSNPNWLELVKRLPAAGLLKDDPELIRKILSANTKQDNP